MANSGIPAEFARNSPAVLVLRCHASSRRWPRTVKLAIGPTGERSTPLQTCDKGHARLTCSVFVTDETQPTLAPQLKATEALIAHSTAAFHQRLGRAMPPGQRLALNDEPNTQP
jgi:hypothetical protein